jgi:hypothetical protein
MVHTAGMNGTKEISTKNLFIFWVPLAATWLIMSVEGPFLSAVIARMSNAIPNLAAFGVSFSLAIIVEAPIIMIMSAATALVKNRLSLQRLFRYTLCLNAVITGVKLILIIPAVFFFLAEDIIQLPSHVSQLSYWATVMFLPWPMAIGFRRFYQGLLITHNQTRRVAYGTTTRLASVFCAAFLISTFSDVSGAVLGAASLSAAVIIEAIASRLMAQQAITHLASIQTKDAPSYREINQFYYPLALTGILTLAAHPIATFFMGQGRMSLESLALMPVLNALVFIFRSVGLSFQEVVIAKIGNRFQDYKTIRNFALVLGLSLVSLLGVVVFTPALSFWYQTVSGLSPEMVSFGITPTRLLFIIPGFTVWIAFQRGIQVVARNTQPVIIATAIELLGIVFCLYVGIIVFDLIGAIAAASAFMVGRTAADLFLIASNRRVLRLVRQAPQGS